MDGFNFNREAKDFYDRLVPNKSDGLILLSLFNRFGEADFKEEEVWAIVNQTLKELGHASARTEYERNNNIILRLQDYFLWRDEIKRVYRFKPYGVEFCRRTQKRLEDNYNPAKIKRWFDDLHNRLQEAVKLEGGFTRWVEDHFDLRHTMLGEQVEILDQQVNESVREFKTQIRHLKGQSDILKTITGIETGLNTIKEQATELKKAFHATYDIDDILTGILEEQEAADFIGDIKRVRDFNNHVRSALEQVSKRIEKIKPRIREFIYDFNQRDFDRKTEQFLEVLLSHSTFGKEGAKRLGLPPGVPRRRMADRRQMPRFTIVPLREFGLSTPMELPRRIVDEGKREKLMDKARAWKHQKDRVAFWASVAFGEIEVSGSLDFPPLFFRILQAEGDNFTIAVKTAHRILRTALKDQGLRVRIDQSRVQDQNNPSFSLWQMNISKV